MEQEGVYKYLPITIEKISEMIGVDLCLPKNRETFNFVLQTAFVAGYTKGESDCIKEYISKKFLNKS